MGQLFNSLEIMEVLVDSGIEQKQSRAIVTAMEKAIDSNAIATKDDLHVMEASLKGYIDLAISKQTVAFGSIMLVGVGILGAIIKLL